MLPIYAATRAGMGAMIWRRGSEPGTVIWSAQQEGDYVSIEIQDDGAGIDPERLREIARNKGLIDAEAAARLSTDECL
ncbi:hypothetical protein KXR77_21330, partial [Xanthomonas euvesicatoria]